MLYALCPMTQDTHTHGPGARRRHSHRRMSKRQLAEHWLKKHLWRKYWAYIFAIVLGLLVAKYCVPVDF
jgi:hypothetical protein